MILWFNTGNVSPSVLLSLSRCWWETCRGVDGGTLAKCNNESVTRRGEHPFFSAPALASVQFIIRANGEHRLASHFMTEISHRRACTEELAQISRHFIPHLAVQWTSGGVLSYTISEKDSGSDTVFSCFIPIWLARLTGLRDTQKETSSKHCSKNNPSGTMHTAHWCEMYTHKKSRVF